MSRIPRNTKPRAIRTHRLNINKTNRQNSPCRKIRTLERSPQEDALFLNSLETPDAEKMSRISKYASYLFGGF